MPFEVPQFVRSRSFHHVGIQRGTRGVIDKGGLVIVQREKLAGIIAFAILF